MNKENRRKILERMGKNTREALRDFIDEQIQDLEKEGTLESKSIEEVFGCKKAIQKLKKFKNTVTRVYPNEEKKYNQYE